MSFEEIIARLPLLTAITFVAGFLLFLISVRFFRRSRKGAYWMQRRRAGQRGLRVFVFSAALFTLSAIFCALTLILSLTDNDEQDLPAVARATSTFAPTSTATLTPSPPTPTPTLPITPSPSPSATTTVSTETTSPLPTPPNTAKTPLSSPVTEPAPTTLSPTPTASFTATETTSPTTSPTETPSPTATLTPSTTPTLAVGLVPSSEPPVAWTAPSSTARLTIVTLSDRLNDNFTPGTPRESFIAGIARIYFFVEFANLETGILWRRELWKDGVLILARTDLWGTETEGDAAFFMSYPDGFPTGAYEIRLFLANRAAPAATRTFTVNP